MKINFSIPVNLFDYKESENSLYTYAKLKIFYVGQTGDKRLFTKDFSDKLLETLPYVPVVGFYDEEGEDFKGHNSEVQHIYGIVPEDTDIEYIKEDGKEYAVCDVILYTGRTDRTGEIAQKIVGKQHSLELNPNDTTYEINRNNDGSLKNIEFKTGSLLGLSVLGDGERPAFAGSGFFNEDSQLMEAFEVFREQLQRFAKENKERGETMELETKNSPAVEETKEVAVEFEETEIETNDIQPGEFLEDFLRKSDDEATKEIFQAFFEEFGDYAYPVQWSTEEKTIIYKDLMEDEFYKTAFEKGEEGFIFSEKTVVRMRFLTDDEIDILWPAANFGAEPTGTKIDQVEDDFNSSTTSGEKLLNEEENTEKVAKETSNDSFALNQSERAELEGYRRERKTQLINSFSDDLSKEFLETLTDKIDEYSYDDLDTALSKEFTRVSREGNRTQKTNTFVYAGEGPNSMAAKTKAEIVKELVETYKTKK